MATFRTHEDTKTTTQLSAPTATPSRTTGAALIALAICFNLPYAWLAMIFDYPGILREPAETILASFNAGGTQFILTWYAFAFAAILFMPVSLAPAIANDGLKTDLAPAISAATTGAVTAAAVTLGAFEGLAFAIKVEAGLFALGSIAGYLLMTIWLSCSGIGLIRS